MGKNLLGNAGDKRCGFDPWVWKIPWRRAWLPPAGFLPGESLGQRGLEGYSPQGHTESDMTEVTKKQQPVANCFPCPAFLGHAQTGSGLGFPFALAVS